MVHKNLAIVLLKFFCCQITQRVTQVGHEFGELKEAKIPTLTTSHSHKVSQFHKNLKSSFGEKLNELQVRTGIKHF